MVRLDNGGAGRAGHGVVRHYRGCGNPTPGAGHDNQRNRAFLIVALIERTRSTVPDSNGQYQLVDLRPGIYALKFVLAGFTTVEREGVQVTGGGVMRWQSHYGARQAKLDASCGSPRPE